MNKSESRKAIVIGIILLFFGMYAVSASDTLVTTNSQLMNREWLYVGGTGPGNYTTIQSAINDANPGDTVFVYSGTYYENVVVNKDNINLIGENNDTTVIDGLSLGDAVDIMSEGVTITGFTVQDGFFGIVLFPYYNNNTVIGNIAHSNLAGIYVWLSNNNTVIGNTAYSNVDYGIQVWLSNNNIVMGNTVSNNDCGIFIDSSSNNSVTENTVLNNDNGIFIDSSSYNHLTGNIVSNYIYGIWIDSSSYNDIIGNTVSDNSFGILLDYSSNNNIIGNTVSDNGGGIHLQVSSNDNDIIQNTITSNSAAIFLHTSYSNTIMENTVTHNHEEIYLYQSNSNNLYHNNLIDNYQDSYDDGSNAWDNGYPSGGNYWSVYIGMDNDGDGIGDTPYNISGGSNQDRYPFMEPNGWVNEPPDKPDKPSGETKGKINTDYIYTTKTIDVDGDQVCYQWDWGDGSQSTWLGPYDSGLFAAAEHSWSVKGDYSIKVKAKDIHDVESDWSDPLPVTMPCSYKIPMQWFWERLFQRFPNAFPLLRHLLGY